MKKLSNNKKVEIIRNRCKKQIEFYKRAKEASKSYLNYLEQYGDSEAIEKEKSYYYSLTVQSNVYYEILFILDDIITF